MSYVKNLCGSAAVYTFLISQWCYLISVRSHLNSVFSHKRCSNITLDLLAYMSIIRVFNFILFQGVYSKHQISDRAYVSDVYDLHITTRGFRLRADPWRVYDNISVEGKSLRI